MTYKTAKDKIIKWLNSGEIISSEWKEILNMCIILINEKISNNDEK